MDRDRNEEREKGVAYVYGHMPSIIPGYSDHTKFPIVHNPDHCEKVWMREQMKIEIKNEEGKKKPTTFLLFVGDPANTQSSHALHDHR